MQFFFLLKFIQSLSIFLNIIHSSCTSLSLKIHNLKTWQKRSRTLRQFNQNQKTSKSLASLKLKILRRKIYDVTINLPRIRARFVSKRPYVGFGHLENDTLTEGLQSTNHWESIRRQLVKTKEILIYWTMKSLLFMRECLINFSVLFSVKNVFNAY